MPCPFTRSTLPCTTREREASDRFFRPSGTQRAGAQKFPTQVLARQEPTNHSRKHISSPLTPSSHSPRSAAAAATAAAYSSRLSPQQRILRRQERSLPLLPAHASPAAAAATFGSSRIRHPSLAPAACCYGVVLFPWLLSSGIPYPFCCRSELKQVTPHWISVPLVWIEQMQVLPSSPNHFQVADI